MLGIRAGTGGGENLDHKADIKLRKFTDLNLTNLASPELVELWRSGSQDAARVLLARYEVRLIALVASRLDRKYRDSVSPEDVVQSAMGSFFRVTRGRVKASIRLESTASAWNILATFARRKLARTLDRETALKRGGKRTRVSLDDLGVDLSTSPSDLDAKEVLAEIHSALTSDQSELLGLLLDDLTQKEIADQLGVDERTVRRRVTVLREVVTGQLAPVEKRSGALPDSPSETINLPSISYRQFVLGSLIGSGALGKVYRARMQTDGQIVAVKFMHRHLWTSPRSRLSFLREIDHASKIDHPGVVKYIGQGQSPHGGPYLVCEYIEGQPLSDVKPQSALVSVEWLVQICAAIAAAHRAGVVHGDLTPSNVLLSQEGRIVITDFGFAANATEPQSRYSHKALSDSPGGTLGFAAPEQISGAFGNITPATDIYAVGGLAYYLLTGLGPHAGSTSALLDTLTVEDVMVPTSARTPAEAKLANVASLTLKKSITRRPQSVEALVALLVD